MVKSKHSTVELRIIIDRDAEHTTTIHPVYDDLGKIVKTAKDRAMELAEQMVGCEHISYVSVVECEFQVFKSI